MSTQVLDPFEIFAEVGDDIFSRVLDADNPYLHISAGVPASLTLSGNDITAISSIGGVATYGLTKEPNSPSYDAGNKWIHFDKSNTEGLINDAIGSDKFAGDDLPFSYALVLRINTLDNNFYQIWTAGNSSAQQPYLTSGINNSNQINIRKRPNSGPTEGPTNGILTTDFIILTVSSSGTIVSGYKDGIKIFNNEGIDAGSASMINQFAIGYFRRDTNANFIDMDVREIAFYNIEVSDARLQAWNTDLNSIYNVY